MSKKRISICTCTLQFKLYIIYSCKEYEDALQIVEQILPYFQPEYTVTMKMVDAIPDNRDVPVF